jgi:hypothetical protein
VKIGFRQISIIILIILVVGLYGCDQVSEPMENTQESPADPCASHQINLTIKPVNGLMRQFVDASDLAFSTPVDQLTIQLAKLQVLRDDMFALDIPDCIAGLKTDGLQYMDATLELFLVFIEDPYSETVSYKMEVMDLHWEGYLAGLSTSLGATLTPSPTPILIIVEDEPLEETEQIELTATEIPLTSETPSPSNTPTNIVPQILVIAPDGVTVRNGPGADYTFLTVLPEGVVAQATGRNVEEAWIQIALDDVSDGMGWVFSTQVELNIPIAELPVVDSP